MISQPCVMNFVILQVTCCNACALVSFTGTHTTNTAGVAKSTQTRSGLVQSQEVLVHWATNLFWIPTSQPCTQIKLSGNETLYSNLSKHQIKPYCVITYQGYWATLSGMQPLWGNWCQRKTPQTQPATCQDIQRYSQYDLVLSWNWYSFILSIEPIWWYDR